MNLASLTKKQLQELAEHLQKQLADLQARNGQGEGATPELQRQVDALTTEVSGLRAAVEEKDATISELQAHVTALVAENASATTLQKTVASSGSATGVHNGITYVVRGKINLHGRQYTAEQAAGDPKVLGHLVDIGSGQVHKVNH